MKNKTDFVNKLLAELRPRRPLPKKHDKERPLIQSAVVAALMRHLTETQAEASLRALLQAFPDWNEVRVSQVQEIARCIRTSSRKKGTALLNEHRDVCMTLKTVLQDIFQQSHGLDLEFLREDQLEGAKIMGEMLHLGMTTSGYLMWLGGDGSVPMHPPLMKLLEKFGLTPKTTSAKKAREAVQAFLPKGKEVDFTIAFHEVLEFWDDENEPSYVRYETLRSEPYGLKAHEDRIQAIAKAEAAAKRDEERRIKEEERERKRLEAEEKKRAAAEEKSRRAAAAKKEKQRKRIAAEQKRKKDAEEKKKKEAAAKKAATKKAAADKRAAVRKAASEKKRKEKEAAAKKAAAKKDAAKKAAVKKEAAKKATAKKAAAKKTAKKAPAKKPAKKGPAKKAPAKKPAKKAPAKKASTKKKPAATKKAPAKKSSAKKSTAKKSTSKKKPTKKR